MGEEIHMFIYAYSVAAGKSPGSVALRKQSWACLNKASFSVGLEDIGKYIPR